MGLGREVDEERDDGFRRVLLQPQRQVHRLATARLARDNDMLVLQQQRGKRVRKADGVHCRHHDVLVLRTRWHRVLRSPSLPWSPLALALALGLIHKVIPEHAVVNVSADLGALLLDCFPQLVIEGLPALVVASSTDRPHQGEEVQRNQVRLQLVDLIRARGLGLRGDVLRKVAVHQPEMRLTNVVVHSHRRLLGQLANDPDHRQRVGQHEFLELVTHLLLEGGRQAFHPRLNQRLVAQSRRLHVHHAASAHRGRRCH
mmetsp:Transcript_22095/g.52451  ORF Transcript_22095/g.52451 Transcript_22095/m.52451 type:complete len:258 (+) Transcript_22095:6102-6875(+)